MIIKQAIFEAIEQRLKPHTKDVLQYIQQLARTQKLSATKSPTDNSSLWQNLQLAVSHEFLAANHKDLYENC